MLVGLIPYGLAGNLRSILYWSTGFKGIGRRVYILGTLDLRGRGDIYPRLKIGADSVLNAPLSIDLSASVHIGTRVGIGHYTSILTGTHELGQKSQRCGRFIANPVTIGDGVWIGSGVIVLPGVEIGDGASIAAGSVVAQNVPPGARVLGNPARVVGWAD
jgi:maltose O-acetyltransferase